MLDELEGWVKALAARDATGFHSAPIVAAANALRDGVDPDAEPVQPRAARRRCSPRGAAADVVAPRLSPSPELAFEPAQEEPATPRSSRTSRRPAPANWPLPGDKPVQPHQTTWASRWTCRWQRPPTPTPTRPRSSWRIAATPRRRLQAPEYAAPDFEFDLGDLDKPALERTQPNRWLPISTRHCPSALDDPSFDLLPGERTTAPAANDAAVACPPATGTHAFDTLTVGDQLPADDAENYKVIGPLRIGLGLFNIFLNEADEQSRRLCTSLAEWVLELPRPVGEEAVALAHSLAGNSATVGHAELSSLARRLEHALEVSQSREVTPDEARLYNDVAEEIRRLLHQFAAGFLQSPRAPLLARFDAFQASPAGAARAGDARRDVQRAREAEAAAEAEQAALAAAAAQAAAADQAAQAAGCCRSRCCR